MAVQAGLLNAQIPMSAKTADIRPVSNYIEGYQMSGEMARTDKVKADVQREFDDRASLDDYLKSGGDLVTPGGVDKALSDLKGKTSPDMYMKLSEHASKVKEGDVKLRENITKMGSDELALRGQQLEKTLTYLAAPLNAYDQAVKTKGEQEAGVEFAKTRDQILQQASKEVGPDGKPIYPPEILQQLAQSDPQHLKSLLASTKYMRDQIDTQYKRSQIQRNLALADWDTTRAENLERGGGTSGAKTNFQKLDEDLKAGRITQEEHDKIKSGMVAKASKPADVSSLSSDAVNDLAETYRINGNLPARLNAYERGQIINTAADKSRADGETSEEAALRKQANKSYQVALNDLEKRKGLTQAFEKDADKRLDLVVELAHKADSTGIPALNRWINAGRKNIVGDNDVNNLNSAVISAQAEIAKVLSGSLGNAGVSDAARAEAGQIINTNMSVGNIDSLVPNIRREFKYKMDSWQETIDEIHDKMKGPKGKETEVQKREKVSPEDQAAKDKDSKKLLLDEYRKEKEALTKINDKDPEMAPAKVRKQGDIDAIRRELKKMGVADPDKEMTAAKPSGIPAGWTVKVK